MNFEQQQTLLCADSQLVATHQLLPATSTAETPHFEDVCVTVDSAKSSVFSAGNTTTGNNLLTNSKSSGIIPRISPELPAASHKKGGFAQLLPPVTYTRWCV